MRIKIYLTQPTKIVPINCQKELNSFLHKILGVNNVYHDTYSNYSISSIQNGKLNDDKRTLSFNNDPYIYVSSIDADFMNVLCEGLELNMESKTFDFYGMHVKKYVIDDFIINEKFDKIITISPILLKKNNWKITVKDNEWLNVLQNQCNSKLKYLGVIDNTFRIEIINPEKSKIKCIHVGNIFNPCSSVRLKIFGEKRTREILYNCGLGNSTGSGFGAIKIYTNI